MCSEPWSLIGVKVNIQLFERGPTGRRYLMEQLAWQEGEI